MMINARVMSQSADLFVEKHKSSVMQTTDRSTLITAPAVVRGGTKNGVSKREGHRNPKFE